MSSLTASASSSSESSWGKVLNALKRIILELKYYTLKISWNWFIFYNLMSFWPGFFNFFYRKISLCICFIKLKTENQDIKGVYCIDIPCTYFQIPITTWVLRNYARAHVFCKRPYGIWYIPYPRQYGATLD